MQLNCTSDLTPRLVHSRNFCWAVDVNETNWAQVRTTSQQICHRGDQRLFSKSGHWHGDDDGVIMIMVIMMIMVITMIMMELMSQKCSDSKKSNFLYNVVSCTSRPHS